MSKEDKLTAKENPASSHSQRLDAIRQRSVIDAKFGYHPYTEYFPKNA